MSKKQVGDAVDWCEQLLENIFDNTKSSRYNPETQKRILDDFNRAKDKIREFERNRDAETTDPDSSDPEVVEYNIESEFAGKPQLLKNQFNRILEALNDPNPDTIKKLVDNIKIKNKSYIQIIQRGIDSTDRKLSGKAWVKQYFENLLQQGSVTQKTFDLIDALTDN